MGKWAVIENGVVVNIVKWDGDTKKWRPKDGQIAVPADSPDCSIRSAYDGEKFTRPAPPPEEPKKPTVEELLAEMSAKLGALNTEVEKLKQAKS